MSKVLGKVAMIAGAVALVATGVGAAAGAGLFTASTATGAATAASITATAATVTTVATVVSVAASVGAQLLAKPPPIQGGVNQIMIGPNNPIPYGMGRSFYPGAQLHDVGYGGTVDKTKNPYMSKAFVWSGGGPIQELESFLVDWQPVTFTAGAAVGYYAGWLYKDEQLGARPEADALAGPWGAIPDWSSAHKLSGMAAGLVSFKFDRKGKVWANGIPAFGMVGKWARVYDWRNDDTYPGGVGTHRFDDEDTFEYDDNVALNAATYARGRYSTNGIKVIGCGFPQDSFDWPAWNAWANTCEANGWTIGGHVFDGPGISLWDNLKRICAAGGAVPVISGGLLSVRFQSPKVAIDTITPEDFADGERVTPGMRTYRDRINSMVPKYRSEANKWEFVQSEAVTISEYVTQDGEIKEEEYPCELVTDKDQAAQLAGYELYNRRELSGITIPCKPRLWRYRLGEALQVIDPDTGLNHLCVIAAASKDVGTATVTLTFETETTAKHAAALAMTGTAPPPPTLIPPGDSDDAAWHNDGGGDPETPDVADWTLTAPSYSSGDGSLAVLRIEGAVGDPFADAVVFEYRVYDVGNGPDDNWLGNSLDAPTITVKEISSVTRDTQYEVAISYNIGELSSDRLILGPVTTAAALTDLPLIDKANTTISGRTAIKTSGVAGWNAAVRSASSLTGSARITFRPAQSNKDVLLGFNASAPTDPIGYAYVDYGLNAAAGGSLVIYETGVSTSAGSYVANDTLAIEYDSAAGEVRYYNGTTLLHTTTGVSAGLTLYLEALFYDLDARIDGMTFEAL